jgi:hypothetical protein
MNLDQFQVGTTTAEARATTTPDLRRLMVASRERAQAALDGAPPRDDDDDTIRTGRALAEQMAAMDPDAILARVEEGWHAVVPIARINVGETSVMIAYFTVRVPEGIGALAGDITVEDFEALPTLDEARAMRGADRAA